MQWKGNEMAIVKFDLYSYRVRESDNGTIQRFTFEAKLPEPEPNLTLTGEQIGFKNVPSGLRLAGRACCNLAEGESCSLEDREDGEIVFVLRSPRANPGTVGWHFSAGEFVREFSAKESTPMRLWFEARA